MLDDHGPEPGMMGKEMGKVERCRPDYETMINKLQIRLHHTANFTDAALKYYEGRMAKNEMATLIGELVTKRAALMLELEDLIRQQEEDPGE